MLQIPELPTGLTVESIQLLVIGTKINRTIYANGGEDFTRFPVKIPELYIWPLRA